VVAPPQAQGPTASGRAPGPSSSTLRRPPGRDAGAAAEITERLALIDPPSRLMDTTPTVGDETTPGQSGTALRGAPAARSGATKGPDGDEPMPPVG